MSFLSPVFLLGLPLIAVPVLIHFFGRRQRDLIRWGAMDFLFASAIPQRRFLRLRDLLLMLLRILVLLAIIGALAQPMISSTWLGTTGPRDVILILDNSLSTSRKVANGTVFEAELDEAAKLMQQLKATDTIRVMLAAPTPEWLNDKPVAGDSGELHALTTRLRELKPNEASDDILDCVQEAVKIGRAGRDMSRIITVVTDGQAHGWRAEATGAWSTLRDLAKKASPPVSMRVIIAGANSSGSANLAVEKLTATRTVVGLGQPVTLTASVKNTGAVSSAPTTLTWSADKESLGISTIPSLPPGAGTTVIVNQPFATSGPIDVACNLTAQDQLPPDNSAHLLLEVARSVPILIVVGESPADPAESDTRFFLAALGYRDGTTESTASASIFKPKVIDYQHLRGENLSASQCVVLANVPRLPVDLVQKLGRYVNAGGGLWIALGEQTDVLAFNQAFFEQSAGLSPLPLKQPIGNADDREKFTGLTPPSPDHPATALLADTHRLDIDRVQIYRRHQFDAGTAVSVTVLLRAQGGAPVAVEKDLGRGRVIVEAIPLGVAWSNLPLCHSYVVLVQEWLWYLAEPGLVKHNLQAGELLQVNESVNASSGTASLETPMGRTVRLLGQEEEGGLAFRYLKTLFPGEYRLTIAGTKGSRTEKFVVSRDPEESNLTPLSPPQIQSLAEAGGLGFGTDPLYQAPGQKVAGPPKALAAWLLIALIIFMAVEITLAFWLTRRRRGKAAAVVMEPGVRV